MNRLYLSKLSTRKPNTNILNLIKLTTRQFYYQDHRHGAGEPQIIAKRVIKTVGSRLRQHDPYRWESVPFTYETKWGLQGGYQDIRTCVMVHEALEREFNIDIDDKKILLGSIADCVKFIMENHASI